MRKKMEWQWEQLDGNTMRSKIIGGWILLHVAGFKQIEIINAAELKKMPLSESMVFIPDRDHEWTIVEPMKEPEAQKSTVKVADFEPQ